MDGLRGVWHGGPFARTRKYVFYPKQILFGTDPVAIDRLLLDIIDDKRKARARSRSRTASPKYLKMDDGARARRRSQRQHHHPRARARGVRGQPRPRRGRPGEDQGPGRRGVSRAPLAGRRCRASTGRRALETAPALKAAGIARLCVPPAQAAAWREAGFSAVAPGRARSSSARDAARARDPRAGRPGLRHAQPLGQHQRLAVPARAGRRVHLRAARGPGRAGRRRGVRLRRGRGPRDRSGRPRELGRMHVVPGASVPPDDLPGRRRPRRGGRRLGGAGRGDEPARPAEPALPVVPRARPEVPRQRRARHAGVSGRGGGRPERVRAQGPPAAHGRASGRCASSAARSSSAG